MSASSSPAVYLLTKEYKNFMRKPHQYMKAYELQNDNITEWIVYVVGPPGTLYDGGIFKTLIRFPVSFPIDPPSVQFLSEFFHPNVYRDGKVCISTLQHPIPEHLRDEDDDAPKADSTSGFWSPANGTESIFMSVISLLSDPNPDDPANAGAADMYVNDRKEYVKQVERVVALSKAHKPIDLEINVDEPERMLSSVSAIFDADECMNSDDEEFDFESGSDDDDNDNDNDDDDDNNDDDEDEKNDDVSAD